MLEQENSQRSVIVLGAGIVGTCVAITLLQEGYRVTIVDREGPAAGASSGNAGAISPGSCIPLATPGMLKQVPKWLLEQDGPLVIRPSYALQAMPWLLRFLASSRPDRFERICDALYALHSPTHQCYEPILKFANASALIRRTGSLTVYETASAFQSSLSSWEARARRGARHEVLSADQIEELVPALGRRFPGAVLQPDHAYVADPHKLVTSFFDAACGAGAKFLRDEALSISDRSDGASVRLASGRVTSAGQVIVATGAASRQLIRSRGLDVPLERQRGYHLHLPTPGVELPLPVSFASSKFYATPMANGIRLAGTVEFARPSAKPNFSRSDRLGGMASRWIDGLQLEGATRWMGNRPCLPDSLPVIDRAAPGSNIILAFGHGHNGMTSAPVTARLVADIIARRKPFINLAPYRANRF